MDNHSNEEAQMSQIDSMESQAIDIDSSDSEADHASTMAAKTSRAYHLALARAQVEARNHQPPPDPAAAKASEAWRLSQQQAVTAEEDTLKRAQGGDSRQKAEAAANVAQTRKVNQMLRVHAEEERKALAKATLAKALMPVGDLKDCPETDVVLHVPILASLAQFTTRTPLTTVLAPVETSTRKLLDVLFDQVFHLWRLSRPV